MFYKINIFDNNLKESRMLDKWNNLSKGKKSSVLF